jgi:putative tryptophan/tyrosine transport system substrate-binding protein
MRRREFIAFVGSVAVFPLAGRAQQTGRLPTVGFLVSGTRSTYDRWVAAFVQRLRELGWLEGRNVAIEYRWAEGRGERYADIAAEFVHLKVNVIVTAGTEAVVAVKQATSVIPIVFASAGDPVANKLVTSLSRPGGNITGLSTQQSDIAAKRLQVMREVVPNLRRLAILANPANPNAALEINEVQAVAKTLRLEVQIREIRRAEDIPKALETIKGRADALYVYSEPLVSANRTRINGLALSAGLPTMHGQRANVEAGGFMSYGPDFLHMFRRAGDYVDKVLRGAEPGEIPVEQPTKFELVINLKTAKALGLAIPSTLLARADEVIE